MFSYFDDYQVMSSHYIICYVSWRLIFLGSARCTFNVSTVFAFWNITLRSSYDYFKGVVHLELPIDILELKLVIIRIPFCAVIFRMCFSHFSILRTFARKFSNVDFFLRLLPLKVDDLLMSEM